MGELALARAAQESWQADQLGFYLDLDVALFACPFQYLPLLRAPGVLEGASIAERKLCGLYDSGKQQDV